MKRKIHNENFFKLLIHWYPSFEDADFLFYLHVEALCAKTREENFAKANSPMRSQGLRRFDANLASE